MICRPTWAGDGVRWWVVHTRPRCEKKMDGWFRDAGMESCLPLRPVRRDYKSKTVATRLPLFPGYAFGCFSEADKKAVYASGHACKILEVADSAGLEIQIKKLAAVLASGDVVRQVAYLPPGSRARVHAGQLKGLEGRVGRVSTGNRVVLSVDFLQRSVLVEIGTECLTPVT